MKNGAANCASAFSLVFAAILLVSPAHAEQDRITAEPHLILGYANFVDEAPLHHFVAGGAVRLYLTRRLAFEPELVYMYRSSADQDLVFVPNVTWDFRAPGMRVVPYFIGGAGLLHHSGGFSSNTRTLGAGFGAKVFLSKHVFAAPEFRLGWEPIYRVTCSIGYSFHRK